MRRELNDTRARAERATTQTADARFPKRRPPRPASALTKWRWLAVSPASAPCRSLRLPHCCPTPTVSYVPLSWPGAGACAIVFSSTDRASFDAVERWKLKVEAEFEGSTPPVMCLVQNKADLVDVASGGAAAAVVGAAEVEAMARKLGMPLFRTSVKLDVNVQAVFEYLAAQFIRRGQARSAASAGSGAFGAAAAGASAAAAAAAAPAAPAAAAAAASAEAFASSGGGVRSRPTSAPSASSSRPSSAPPGRAAAAAALVTAARCSSSTMSAATAICMPSTSVSTKTEGATPDCESFTGSPRMPVPSVVAIVTKKAEAYGSASLRASDAIMSTMAWPGLTVQRMRGFDFFFSHTVYLHK